MDQFYQVKNFPSFSRSWDQYCCLVSQRKISGRRFRRRFWRRRFQLLGLAASSRAGHLARGLYGICMGTM